MANRFLISLYATPGPEQAEVFYTVVRAGHLVAGPEHRVEREHFPGHEIILCLSGRGWVTVGGRTQFVDAGDVVWLDCSRAHAHGAVQDCPWEVYWVRADGPQMGRLAQRMGVWSDPVVRGADTAELARLLEGVFEALPLPDGVGMPRVHAAVAGVVALIYEAWMRREDRLERAAPVLLRPAMERMTLFFFEKHTVAGLARLCGMSGTHFSRLFHRAFGTSPIDWLRRFRISQAKRLLVETTLGVEEIAFRTGYGDRFFFSKDFRRYTGATPREFRTKERREHPQL
jgi:AraC family transcriptional regulator, arabinose operon regulatory protein